MHWRADILPVNNRVLVSYSCHWTANGYSTDSRPVDIADETHQGRQVAGENQLAETACVKASDDHGRRTPGQTSWLSVQFPIARKWKSV
jgi:hypothetical protein